MAQELTLKRTFDAPREIVFKAWTEAGLMAKWWGPYLWSNPICELDARPGGAIYIIMRGPGNVDSPMKGVFNEVDAPRRLVFTTSALEDEDGNPQIENINTVTFSEEGNKTEVTLHVVVVKSSSAVAAALAGMEAGWTQSWGKLSDLLASQESSIESNKANLTALPGVQEVVITRLFDAPCEVLFKVITDPELLPKWWGPRYLTTVVDKMEVRQGGIWRFIQEDPHGYEYAFHGVYHEVKAPERLVYTFEFEGMPGRALLETVAFAEQDGRTVMTDKLVFQSVEDRDGMLKSGMESGSTDSMERLAELLIKV